MKTSLPLTKKELKKLISIFEDIWSCEIKYQFNPQTKELILYDSSIPGEYCKTFSNSEVLFFKATGLLLEDYLYKNDKKKYNYYFSLLPSAREKYIEKYITKFLNSINNRTK